MAVHNQGSAGKLVVGLIALAAIIYAGWHVKNKVTARQEVEDLSKLEERYLEADTPDEFRSCLQELERMRGEVSSPQARKRIDAWIAGSKAWIAWLDTQAKPSVAKYEDALAKMEKAKELSSKPELWARKIESFEERLDRAKGPKTVAEMRRRFAAAKEMSWRRASDDLRALYRWGERWKEAGMHESDTARWQLLEEVRQYLVAGYSERFEQSAAKAQNPPDTLQGKELLLAQAAPLGWLAMVDHFAPDKAAAYRKEYSDVLAQAREAQKKLEAMAG